MTEKQKDKAVRALSFCERYDKLKKKEAQRVAPPVAFVRQVAKVTMSSETTVYFWCTGRRKPDALARAQIAKLLGEDEATLFPNL